MFANLKTIAVLILTAVALTLATVPASAQMSSQVQFEAGNDNAALNGTITGQEYRDYVLRARGGQTMSVALTVDSTNGNGTAYFNILPPGSDGVAIYNGSMDGTGFASVKLPKDGDYTIRVYLMGNDRDADKTVGFTVSVTIM